MLFHCKTNHIILKMYNSGEIYIYKCGLPACAIGTSADAIKFWQTEHVVKVYQGVPGFLPDYMYRGRDGLK